MRSSTKALLSTCSPFVVAIGVFAICSAAAPTEAQVLAYELEFSQEDHGINFDFYDGGYFVVDGRGGAGSFVVWFREGKRRLYLASEGAGELFFAVRNREERAVIRADARIGTARSQYLLVGELSDSVVTHGGQGRGSLLASPLLRGRAVVSDSESEIEAPGPDGSIGFAGFAEVTARLDRERTRAANSAGASVDEVLRALLEELEAEGFQHAAAPDGGGKREVRKDDSAREER